MTTELFNQEFAGVAGQLKSDANGFGDTTFVVYAGF